MPIYKVTTLEGVGWGENKAVIVRATDSSEAIELALEDYGSDAWNIDNCEAEVIPEKGESTFILRDNIGD